jgi:hypothetical protein
VSGSGTTYDVTVSGMTSNGTVTATVPAGRVQGSGGNSNSASTSTDNQVLFWSGWTNPVNACDVDGMDGVVPQDVLLIVNFINSLSGSHWLPPPSADGHFFVDPSDDGYCTPLDVLLVINHVNLLASAMAEGEAVDHSSNPPACTGDGVRPASWSKSLLEVLDELATRRIASSATPLSFQDKSHDPLGVSIGPKPRKPLSDDEADEFWAGTGFDATILGEELFALVASV